MEPRATTMTACRFPPGSYSTSNFTGAACTPCHQPTSRIPHVPLPAAAHHLHRHARPTSRILHLARFFCTASFAQKVVPWRFSGLNHGVGHFVEMAAQHRYDSLQIRVAAREL